MLPQTQIQTSRQLPPLLQPPADAETFSHKSSTRGEGEELKHHRGRSLSQSSNLGSNFQPQLMETEKIPLEKSP